MHLYQVLGDANTAGLENHTLRTTNLEEIARVLEPVLVLPLINLGWQVILGGFFLRSEELQYPSYKCLQQLKEIKSYESTLVCYLVYSR